MASIEKLKGVRGTSYYVSIRRAGHPPIYERFDSIAEARAFAARTEANIADGRHHGFARIRTLADLIDPKDSSYPGAASVGGGVGRPNCPTMRWQM